MTWLIDDNMEGREIGYRAILDEDGTTICNPSPMGGRNAALIAAAPDLLAALEMVMIRLGELCEKHNEAETFAASNARAVMKKARGDHD